jgi:hypothetical protein
LGDCKRAKGNRTAIPGAVSCGVRGGSTAVILALALSVLGAGGGYAATHTEYVEFDPADLKFSRAEGYDLVSLGGDRWLNRPGEPRLPVEPYRLALPPGTRVECASISVEAGFTLDGEFSILPSPVPQPLSSAQLGMYAPHPGSVYLMDGLYPASAGEHVGAGTIDGIPICDIILYPLRYKPSERELVLSTRVRIAVEYVPDEARVGSVEGPGAGMVRGLVSGSVSQLSPSGEKAPRSLYADIGKSEIAYLIITDSSLAAAFEPLLEWKRRKGVSARLVTLDQVNSTFPGSDLPARIRNCIDHYHSDYATIWVLLGGDTDLIPERRLYVALSDKTSIPSDLYYADLDGTWNGDGDLRWGEVPEDDVDMYADVYVGRAPVSSVDETKIFVNKVLAYEGVYGSRGNHVTDMLFLAEILWGELGDPSNPEYTDGGVAKDMIEAGYVPGDFTVLKLYESLYNLTTAATEAALNDGQGIVNVNCHGAVSAISLGGESLPMSSVMNLTNGPSYGLMYATSCMAGAYEQSCIGEAYVRSPAGGGFFVGNSRYGWGLPGSPGLGPSDQYDQSFFETLFITGLENLGKAHAYAKHEYVAESRYDDYYRYVMYGLNLFGDPETPLWTAQPAELAAEFPAVVCGAGDFDVAVTSGGVPAAGTTVCLYKPGDVYAKGGTDALGAMTFYIEPTEPGTLYVTVTGVNYLPYMGYSIVDDGSTGIPSSRGPMPLSLSIEPNPFRSKVCFTVTGAPGSEVKVEVFDILGRRVVGFDVAASESGVGAVIWEGRDARGREVSPGIYVVRVASDTAAISRKALIIR